MSRFPHLFRIVALAGVVALAAPASAQYERPRSGRVADEIARGIRETADAIGTVRDAYDESINGVRFGRQERYAIDRCLPSVQRYGRVRVEDVRPYSRRSWRVYGTVDSGGGYGRDRYYSGSRYRDRYGARSFTCTVKYDGRVKVKTRRLRY